MNAEERQLIAGLFDRMRSYGAPDKDREAEALISQSVRANPDATYMLVQSVLVQEQALEATNARVAELEDQLRRMEGGEEQRGSRSGGFLGGGYWGDRRGQAPASSVPQVGARATPSAYDRPSSAWSQTPPPPQQPAPQASGGGGGFMKSALATAAGVAGGVLVADSIRNMMGGGAHASPFGRSRDDAPTDEEVVDDDPGSDDSDSDPGQEGDTGGDGGGEIEV